MLEIPNDLKDFIKDDGMARTPYSKELKKIMRALIAQNLGIIRLVTTKSVYNQLAIDISNDAKGLAPFMNIEDFDIPIESSTLVSLCFPETKTKEKDIIIVVYTYLNETLPQKEGLKFGTYYINNLKSKSSKGESPFPNIKGAQIIDARYRKHILTQTKEFSAFDFYTSKDENHSQWYGIFYKKGWDVRREDYPKIKNIIKHCFDIETRNKVALVVSGNGGSGKSTLLRRIAADIIDGDYVVIWVKNIEGFLLNIETIEEDNKRKYLVIIEDWERLKGTTSIGWEFLNHVSNTNNVRIVIGDRENTDKEYLDYFDEDNIVRLHPNQNSEIIKQVIKNCREWVDIANEVLQYLDINQSRLFLILFVIAKTHKHHLSGNSIMKFDSIDTAFKSIVRDDLRRVNKNYPGVALTIYYWANIYKENKYKNPILTWEGFVSLCNHFNAASVTISKQSAVREIIMDYIKIVRITDRVRAVEFHHDLFAEYGLCQKIGKDWSYDDTIKGQLCNILYNLKQRIDYREFSFLFGYPKKPLRLRFMDLNLWQMLWYNLYSYHAMQYSFVMSRQGEHTSASIVLEFYTPLALSAYFGRKDHKSVISELKRNSNNLSYILPELDLNSIEVERFIVMMKPHLFRFMSDMYTIDKKDLW